MKSSSKKNIDSNFSSEEKHKEKYFEEDISYNKNSKASKKIQFFYEEDYQIIFSMNAEKMKTIKQIESIFKHSLYRDGFVYLITPSYQSTVISVSIFCSNENYLEEDTLYPTRRSLMSTMQNEADIEPLSSGMLVSIDDCAMMIVQSILNHNNSKLTQPKYCVDYLKDRCSLRENIFMSKSHKNKCKKEHVLSDSIDSCDYEEKIPENNQTKNKSYKNDKGDKLTDNIVKDSMNLMDFIGIH